MPSQEQQKRCYAISAAIRIGAVLATSVAMSASEIVFDTPSILTAGQSIEFQAELSLDGDLFELQCRGTVTACEPTGGSFRAHATIDAIRVANEAEMTSTGLVAALARGNQFPENSIGGRQWSASATAFSHRRSS